MKRHFGWAAVVAAGILLGLASSPYPKTNAAPPAVPVANSDAQQAAILDQLKEIKTQLKELNAMFHSGDARVTIVINPGKP